MTRDRSLDEFFEVADEPSEPDESESDAEPTTEPEPSGDESEPDDPEPDVDAVEPAVSTYEFSPDGAPCAACGAVVQKRWRDDGELVCPDCKAW